MKNERSRGAVRSIHRASIVFTVYMSVNKIMITLMIKIIIIFFSKSALKIIENATLRFVFSIILSPTEIVDYF